MNVVAVIAAAPGSEQDVARALATLAAATREEAGCRAYEVFESAAVPGTFVTIEDWGGQSDLDAHMQSPHMATAVGSLDGKLAGAPAIHPLTPVS